MFKHAKGCVFLLSRFLVENGGAKMNDRFFAGEDSRLSDARLFHAFFDRRKKPLRL
jgi:hypothetical protein